MRNPIPFPGSERYAAYRKAVGAPLDADDVFAGSQPRERYLTKEQIEKIASAARVAERCARRGMPVGVVLQKKTGRYLARLGKLYIPGSFATIELALAAREAMKKRLGRS